MEMNNILLDTNILVYHVAGDPIATKPIESKSQIPRLRKQECGGLAESNPDILCVVPISEDNMRNAALREKLIKDIESMTSDKIEEVASFVNYLNLKEDQWFINLVNKRTRQAEVDKKAGKKFVSLEELTRDYE